MNQENNNLNCDVGFSKAAKYQKNKKIHSSKLRVISDPKKYVILDVETTGLSHLSDEIIEMAAIKIVNGKLEKEIQTLVQCEKTIPDNIVQLTGITQEEIKQKGISLYSALQKILSFVDGEIIVCHNVAFDLGFIQSACKKVQLPLPKNAYIDTRSLARIKLKGIADYQLKTIAEYFSIDIAGIHRALKDCHITYGIYKKLNEM